MKLILKCECGNYVEVEPETYGNVAYFERALREKDFDIDDRDIDIQLNEDIVRDPDDVSAKLKEMRLDCRQCGRYLILDWRV